MAHSAAPVPAPLAGRVRAIDWLRGIAVVVMIQTHALSLLRPDLHAGDFFVRLQWVDGLVAPSFLFAAGFSLALVQARAAMSAAALPGARAKRVRKTLRRIGEVLFVATLMNSMWFPIFREPKWLLRIDILQCIGLSLLLAVPLIAGAAARPHLLRWGALALAALAYGLAPLAEPWTGLAGHLFSAKSGSPFPLLPWAGHVWLGASAGAICAEKGAAGLAKWLGLLVAAGLLAWFFTDRLAAAYPPHEFWVTNPANSARRWTQVCAFALVLLAAERWAPAAFRTSLPIRFFEVFGASSLAGYFFHEALLFFRTFGLSFHRFWGDRASWEQYWGLYLLLLAMTFVLTWLADKAYTAGDKKLQAAWA